MNEIYVEIAKDIVRHDNNLKYLYNGWQKTRKVIIGIDKRVSSLTLGLLGLGYCVYKLNKRVKALEGFAEENQKG